MHRLLQGDVGSGKTIVALFAALLAMENGYQAAIMAPTELLAEQHARTMTRLLAPLGIAAGAASPAASTRASAREVADAARERASPLLVDRHARAGAGGDGVRASSASSSIDEQHRFGVEQRKALGAKGEAPDVLLMSATPIPRSLALTLYGDLDVSMLDERPPGRQPVTTALRPESARERVLQFVDREIEQGPPGVRRLSGDRGVGEDRPQGGDDDVRELVGGRVRGPARRAAARPHPGGRARRDHARASATARSTCSSRRR